MIIFIVIVFQETWICLKCGSFGCGLEDDCHARIHFEVPRSDSHCIALQLDKWSVWLVYKHFSSFKQIKSKHLGTTTIIIMMITRSS